MVTYYAKRALEIFRRDGIVELIKKLLWKVTSNFYYPCIVLHLRPIRYRILGYSAPPNPNKRLHLDPQKIEYRASGKVYQYKNRANYGKIKKGDWDKQCIPFEQNNKKYLACEKRIKKSIPWKETGIIEHYTEWTDGDFNGIDGCYSRQDVINLYEEQREELYQSLKQDGFDEKISKKCCDIHIGRNGELIFARQGGHHRLSICKLLNIDSIPVNVVFRHKEWQEVREDIYSNGLPEDPEELCDHPDLQDVIDG